MRYRIIVLSGLLLCGCERVFTAVGCGGDTYIRPAEEAIIKQGGRSEIPFEIAYVDRGEPKILKKTLVCRHVRTDYGIDCQAYVDWDSRLDNEARPFSGELTLREIAPNQSLVYRVGNCSELIGMDTDQFTGLPLLTTSTPGQPEELALVSIEELESQYGITISSARLLPASIGGGALRPGAVEPD